MEHILLTRRMFMKMVNVLNESLEIYSNDHMFVYYVQKNLSVMLEEYNRLVKLSESGAPSERVIEFFEKKGKMIKTWLSLNKPLKELHETDEYREMVTEYDKDIYEHDVNSNKINSFLIKKELYDVVKIPMRYIPSEIDPTTYMYVFKLIEEDVHLLSDKVGV